MSTVLAHFYNEEYFLPFWLEYHKKYFDHGIMINYSSTDRSEEIIRSICPTWQVVQSANQYFEAYSVDREVTNYESNIEGFKICLNITEYLVGDHSVLQEKEDNTQLIIPVHYMVDKKDENHGILKKDLLREKTYGIKNEINNIRRSRSFHNYNVNYLDTAGPGRHYTGKNTDDFIILYYGFCPFNDIIIRRKLAFNEKLPPGHKLFSEVEIRGENTNYLGQIEDLSSYYLKFL